MEITFQRRLGSIWFWWAITTVIYSLLTFTMTDGAIGTLQGYLFGFVGLFVPYGPMSSILFLTPVGWVSLFVFVVTMRYAHRAIQSRNVATGSRIFLICASLMIITVLVDIARFTPFQSWVIFLSGGKPGLN